MAAAVIPLIGSLTAGNATSGGDPYSAPDVVDTNPDPNIVETTITAEDASVDIGNNVTAHALTFNGSIPGPTFHLKVGDTVIVHFENHIAEGTGIHWHGIELPNAMDGTPLTQNRAPPGGSFLYKFKVNRPGIFWYHPHHHSSTNQVFKGMYGMIVVDDPNDGALRAARDAPVAGGHEADRAQRHDGLQDAAERPGDLPERPGGLRQRGLPSRRALRIPRSSARRPRRSTRTAIPRPAASARATYPTIQQKAGARENEGQTVLTNGKNVGGRAGGPTGQGTGAPGALVAGASTLDVKRGQGLRLQLLNASTIRYMRLRLTDKAGGLLPMFRVGGEGGLLNQAIQEGGVSGTFDTKYTAGEILLPPGSRADVVLKIPSAGLVDGDVLTLWTEDYKRIGQGAQLSNIPTVPVMHLKINGAAATPYTITRRHGAAQRHR